ncbi:MAG: hypothetical protein JXA33_08855 [Anaerolineae bacterium]|nr:hypothetical protein [Anaerolineae bacterium]
MDIRNDIFQKHLAEAAVEQIALEYQQRGYEVITEYVFDGINFDLLVRNDKEAIVFEIKVGEWSDKRRQIVKKIWNIAVHKLRAKFKLVLVNLPEKSDIVVDDLENVFRELLPSRYESELSELATQYRVDEISDIYFELLFMNKEQVEAKGSAILTLELQYGADSDLAQEDGFLSSESFPFYFHILLDRNIQLKEVYMLKLDVLGDIE